MTSRHGRNELRSSRKSSDDDRESLRRLPDKAQPCQACAAYAQQVFKAHSVFIKAYKNYTRGSSHLFDHPIPLGETQLPLIPEVPPWE